MVKTSPVRKVFLLRRTMPVSKKEEVRLFNGKLQQPLGPALVEALAVEFYKKRSKIFGRKCLVLKERE